LFLLFTGCSTANKIAATTATIGEPNIKIAGESFDVLALDFSKATSLDFQSLRAQVIQEMSRKGMIQVNATKVEPRYLILFDYAVDLGDESPYERRFVAVTYDTKLEHIVHRIRVISKGTSNDVGNIFPPIVKHVYEIFPASNGFQNATIGM